MCSMRTSDASRRGSGTVAAVTSAGGRRRVAGGELEPVPERRADDGEAVAAPARRPGKVDDEGRPAKPRDAAREQRVRRPRERVRANRLGDARRLAIEDAPGRLGRHVARREAGSSRCQYEQRAGVGELVDRGRDHRRVVRRRRGGRPRSRPRGGAPRARRRSCPRARRHARRRRPSARRRSSTAPSSSRRAGCRR